MQKLQFRLQTEKERLLRGGNRSGAGRAEEAACARLKSTSMSKPKKNDAGAQGDATGISSGCCCSVAADKLLGICGSGTPALTVHLFFFCRSPTVPPWNCPSSGSQGCRTSAGTQQLGSLFYFIFFCLVVVLTLARWLRPLPVPHLSTPCSKLTPINSVHAQCDCARSVHELNMVVSSAGRALVMPIWAPLSLPLARRSFPRVPLGQSRHGRASQQKKVEPASCSC
ncbi:hypothetical protein B0T25DRAFT_174962 [Lasiosphaeria hispida]|uniref:Uncharacterized protein n=1 Tax=Lasiosphaeria hispida TaxID=260671 RepID=A0AAJ0MGN4_9PEZI|nr:hypothetical protein B0T25DRAFT_174962 [Lasiosphaeria hispida]